MKNHIVITMTALALTALSGCVVEQETNDWDLRGATTPNTTKRKCTYTQGWYKNHNIYARQARRQIAWPIAEDTYACGTTWYELLYTVPEGDPWMIFAHQWMVATMNRLAGAFAPPDVAAALAEGTTLLRPCGIDSEQQAARMLELAPLLDAFNNGEVGPGHCDDVLGE